MPPTCLDAGSTESQDLLLWVTSRPCAEAHCSWKGPTLWPLVRIYILSKIPGEVLHMWAGRTKQTLLILRRDPSVVSSLNGSLQKDLPEHPTPTHVVCEAVWTG